MAHATNAEAGTWKTAAEPEYAEGWRDEEKPEEWTGQRLIKVELDDGPKWIQGSKEPRWIQWVSELCGNSRNTGDSGSTGHTGDFGTFGIISPNQSIKSSSKRSPQKCPSISFQIQYLLHPSTGSKTIS